MATSTKPTRSKKSTHVPKADYDGLSLKNPRNNEELFRPVWEASVNAMVLSDAEGKVIEANPAYFDLYRYSPDEIIGKDFTIIFPESEREAALKNYKKFFSSQETIPVIESKIRRNDGVERVVESRYTFLEQKGKRTAMLSIIKDITKEKLIEDARSRLAAIVESSDDAIISKTLNGVITSWNKAAERIFGYTAYEAIGKKITIIIPRHLRKEEKIIISNLRKGKHIDHFETIRRTKDGRDIYVSLSISPVRNDHGDVVGASKIARDITERKQAEERLHNSEEKLLIALDAGKIGVWEWDIKNNHIIWTDKVYELHGVKKDQFGGTIKSFIRFVHPEDQRQLQKLIDHAIKHRTRFQNEFRVVWPDKSIHWLYTHGQIVTDTQGKPTRMVGATIENTDRKNNEVNMKFLSEASKVLSSSLEYKTTLGNVAKLAIPHIADWCGVDIVNEYGILDQVAVAHIDPEKIKWAKELRKQQPVNMNAWTGIPNVMRTGKSEIYPFITDEMLVATSKNKKELSLIRSLGLTSVIIVPLFSAGKAIGGISFVTTESRKRYTLADLSIAEEVASRASLAIENSRLYTEAQKAINLRDEFISVASHELKTPITSLKMYTQVLQKRSEKKGDEELLNYFDKMENQVNKLTVLISDLLNVSKLQHGKLEFNKESMDLTDVIKETIDAIQATAIKHTIILKGNIRKNVYADRYRIYQVLTNLLTNAMKYSPNAHRVIVELLSEKNAAVVRVHDFGIGIERRHVKNIFQQFYRVTSPEEKTYPGLGMGLYIAHEIIIRHGGEMTVTSRKGKGSVFSFTLPYHRPR